MNIYMNPSGLRIVGYHRYSLLKLKDIKDKENLTLEGNIGKRDYLKMKDN